MPDQLPPTTALDIDATSRSPCCDARLELSSPPHGYECRECLQVFDLSETATDSAQGDSSESDGETPGRVKKYVDDGLCGYYDDETMQSPCSRSEGWGTDSDTGPCSAHS